MLKLSYHVSSEALADITEISIHYEAAVESLGDKFLDEFYNVSLETIRSNPYAFAKFRSSKSIRRFVMKRFPYKIFYYCSSDPIKIIAVIHSSRSTRHIKRRLK